MKKQPLQTMQEDVDEVLAYKTGFISNLADTVRSIPTAVKAVGLGMVAAGVLYFSSPKKVLADDTCASYALVNENCHIRNISDFLNSCPKGDPAYEQIKKDFKIRKNGVLVNLDSIVCSEPASAMNPSDYSDVLLVVQALRFMYYMDFGKKGHLPYFKEGAHYDWLKSQIKGINISDSAPNFACCATFDGETPYIILPSQGSNAAIFGTFLEYLVGYVASISHEADHWDPKANWTRFPHVSCNGHSNIDQTFDLNNMSPVAVSWWVTNEVLSGDSNVGYSCDSARAPRISSIILETGNQFQDFFCDVKPPVLTMPSKPGGSCVGSKISGSLKDSQGNGVPGFFVDLIASDDEGFAFSTYETGPSGLFTHVRLEGDDYKLLFVPPDECFKEAWFDKKSGFSGANVIALLDNQSIDNLVTTADQNDIPAPKDPSINKVDNS